MKVTAWVDVYLGVKVEDLFISTRALADKLHGFKRYRIEFELPEPEVDGVRQAAVSEEK